MLRRRVDSGAPGAVAIIGAGPYGLSAAAHLRSAGVEALVFGRAMESWERRMPRGMLLRSAREASHIAGPGGSLTLDDYEASTTSNLPTPLPLLDFIAYGRWFQRHAVPDLDVRRVRAVDGSRRGFELSLEDGERVTAQRVIVATGINAFAWRPPPFTDLPSPLVSHSADHDDLSDLAGRRVLVVGGGQSALESGALLRNAGSEVEILVRHPRVHWLRGGALRARLGPLRPLVYPSTDVGPPGLNQIVARPHLFRGLPRGLRGRLAERSIRPAGAPWLKPRLGSVTLTVGRHAVAARPARSGVLVTLDDGSERFVDHALLATGHRVEVSRYSFLAPDLVRAIGRVGGYPRLGAGFESTVPGLHFLGAAAAESYGPLMRFVSGTGFASRALTRQVAGERSTVR